MPLDDIDLPPSGNHNPIQKKFYKSGIILIVFGLLSFLFLFFSYSGGYESAFNVPFIYLPLIIGLTPFLFSFIYSFFERSIKKPLKNSWGKVHFYLTIPPFYFIQLLGIIHLHHLYMSGVNPFMPSYSPISIFWLVLIIGQLFFFANLFRSLKLSFYKNSNFHPTHYLFLFAAFFFIIKSGLSYIFGDKNSYHDLQIHDTYYVISFLQINLFFVFIFLLFSSLYYFSNRNLKKPLNSFLSKTHFILMALPILYFSLFFYSYDPSSHIYYDSLETRAHYLEAMTHHLEAISYQKRIIIGSFLFAQIIFLINFSRSAILSFFQKKLK